jgi:hypothetical protein
MSASFIPRRPANTTRESQFSFVAPCRRLAETDRVGSIGQHGHGVS